MLCVCCVVRWVHDRLSVTTTSSRLFQVRMRELVGARDVMLC